MRHNLLVVALVGVLLLVSSASAMRLVTIGDLHGDLGQCLALLKATKMVSFQPEWYKNQLVNRLRNYVSTGDSKEEEVDRKRLNANMLYNKRGELMAGSNPDSYHWSGGRSILVILGDAFNVGPDDLDIARFFMRLDEEAKQAGGQLVYLYGNHEIHNLENDFSGVHPWSFERSGGREGREHQLSMATPLGRYLRTRKALFEYDGLIFMHGGLFPKTVQTIKSVLKPFNRATFVNEINAAVTKAFTSRAGRKPDDPVSELILDANYDTNGDKGPLLVHPLKECALVQEANKMLGGLQAQVVGHTPHKPPTYKFCDGALYAIDFTMSRWKGGEGSAFAALEFMRIEVPSNVTGTAPTYRWEAELVIPSVKELKALENSCGYSGPTLILCAGIAVVIYEFVRRRILKWREERAAWEARHNHGHHHEDGAHGEATAAAKGAAPPSYGATAATSH